MTPWFFLQAPATQVSLAAQACPQVMQWSWLVIRSKQLPEQQLWVASQGSPPPHSQVVPTQLLPFSHDGAQLVCWQLPLTQANPDGQAGASHEAPQWVELDWRSKQPSPQQVSLPTHFCPLQSHSPCAQLSPVLQEMSQPPQWAGLPLGSAQVPPQQS
jgi:hypothetical protein